MKKVNKECAGKTEASKKKRTISYFKYKRNNLQLDYSSAKLIMSF